MARALGISCKSDEIMLAVAENGVVVEDDHERVRAPALYEESEQLKGVFDAIGRVITETRAEVVRVLLPEQTYKGSYMALAPRATLEALVRLAANNAHVPVEVLYRNTARARVGMPKSGNFESHIASVIPTQVGRYWKAGRRLAAIAAVAGENE
jgi:predicted NBD/HSP70 family sugar kinase